MAQCPMGGETCLGSFSARLNVYIRASEGGNGPRSRAFARQSDPSRTRQASSLHPLDSCIDAFRNRNELGKDPLTNAASRAFPVQTRSEA